VHDSARFNLAGLSNRGSSLWIAKVFLQRATGAEFCSDECVEETGGR
jgi:hypothetical protein